MGSGVRPQGQGLSSSGGSPGQQGGEGGESQGRDSRGHMHYGRGLTGKHLAVPKATEPMQSPVGWCSPTAFHTLVSSSPYGTGMPALQPRAGVSDRVSQGVAQATERAAPGLAVRRSVERSAHLRARWLSRAGQTCGDGAAGASRGQQVGPSEPGGRLLPQPAG